MNGRQRRQPALAESSPNISLKRSHSEVKKEDVIELPHNLGTIPKVSANQAKKKDVSSSEAPHKSRRTSKKTSPKQRDIEDTVKTASTPAEPLATPSKSKSKKASAYGLTLGVDPYPDHPYPTLEQCEEVHRLLAEFHGESKAPKTVPPPSLTVSGCGEVPSVLDAAIRTVLSATTTGHNSAAAFKGLVERFGILDKGIGKGSVNWNKVRLASQEDVKKSIAKGGLQDTKSKSIKAILQMVWEENQARKNALLASDGAEKSSKYRQEDKDAEIGKAEEDVLSLDHLHNLPTFDAFNELIKYPAIGPKTASCILLFCLQRPSFAVDTHVFRMCKYLGWVPLEGDPAGLPKGSNKVFRGPKEISTFAHCEMRVPDHLKYPLHHLLIKHGKACPRCRASTSVGYKDWNKGCVIEHLVKRYEPKKQDGKKQTKQGSTKNSLPKKVYDEESSASPSVEPEYGSESENDDLSELSDAEEEHADTPMEGVDDEDIDFKPSVARKSRHTRK